MPIPPPRSTPDPIAAIATAPGRGAVGIVRVSGPDLRALAQALCGRVLAPREASYGPFLDEGGAPIDQGLALHFPAPRSYTGEDVLELQAHGGPVVLQLLLARCLQAAAEVDPAAGLPRLPRLRLARPGEFTERAFLNGKLDLAQAEAVADLIDASTAAAARSASRSLAGEFSRAVHALRDGLVHLRMLIEATLDFPEEEIDVLSAHDVRGQLSNLQQSLAGVQARARQGALLREGIKVVIAGQPNAGKSSLLNALAGAELAIVTPIAGTTRDVVQQTIQIDGVPLHVLDTAGLRESGDEVERIGIARAWDHIESADAVLWLHDLTRRDAPDYIAAESVIERKLPAAVPVLHLWNKHDAAPGAAVPPDGLLLSARTGEGLNELRQRLLHLAGWQGGAGEGLFLARERHLQALAQAAGHLHDAGAHLQGPALDLLAEELRLAQNALGAITGEFTADDLLGVIFARFCIGK
ncbi:tRNA uridine-5-carboxymethylaminomethyl(34) synthesis GTPase MnmE [Ottowia sp.]|jgi:tRNA modification GTPase|uniref:tRNA uridine-5-carboxymethylaminomethyl(34) synthesis GTPase MnmE n=1 Tax=Ottowia sp. TaxID=1898956 RepID=UPI0025CB8D55|nr:tRNA uridine-5-carboxymethylaminomethyl(34) synthesis GTPase MnmE [Ottowia sp.]MBK6614991.1 tRNA uridine-5-carboxymethylaminomethyl(34) synthesis GTPase MnmE [Ottowia sp.]MBK6746072.1 tRNA uridine-5-carboxymethylaminomethyl(34) synthesis GTPase MnmE [Ottowia sp.]